MQLTHGRSAGGSGNPVVSRTFLANSQGNREETVYSSRSARGRERPEVHCVPIRVAVSFLSRSERSTLSPRDFVDTPTRSEAVRGLVKRVGELRSFGADENRSRIRQNAGLPPGGRPAFWRTRLRSASPSPASSSYMGGPRSGERGYGRRFSAAFVFLILLPECARMRRTGFLTRPRSGR